ncbi:MAG: hypothetical protein HY343_03675 [Lentisphaerae bacterium]|nr:hypothetical protein [Lentisphaerota bacterium]
MTPIRGQYPHFSHVKNNRRYAGKEDVLMASAGFRPLALAEAQLPFPFLDEWKFYVKEAAR